MEEKPNIYQRLDLVRQEVEYIKKDAIVQGYRAVTHDMVTAKVRDSLIEHGIMILPNRVESKTQYLERKSKQGNSLLLCKYEAVFEITFVNIDNPEDKFSVFADGHAEDYNDKAPGKALSYATKNMILKVLNLETGESDESRVEDDRRGYTDQQKQSFDDIVAANDSLGLYLLSLQIDTEIYNNLFNSGEKGKKTELKNKCREMESLGQKTESSLSDAIRNGDSTLAYESTQGMSHVGQALLRRHLGREGNEELNDLLKEVSET